MRPPILEEITKLRRNPTMKIRDPEAFSLEEEVRKDAYFMLGEPDLAELWSEPGRAADALIFAHNRRLRQETLVKFAKRMNTFSLRFEDAIEALSRLAWNIAAMPPPRDMLSRARAWMRAWWKTWS